jgi:hypothetical protein
MARLSKQTLLPPVIESVLPAAALPGGDVELRGANLGPRALTPPVVLVDGISAHLADEPRQPPLLPRSRSRHHRPHRSSQPGWSQQHGHCMHIARELSDGLHPVTSPVVSRSGMTFATISGPARQADPGLDRPHQPGSVGTPFVSGILNPTGLAFDPDGELYVTSRAEGNVYRIDAGGEATVYAEGMGVATGAAFDAEGNLFVGDRNGTIFKIAPGNSLTARIKSSSTPRWSRASPPTISPSARTARSS